MAGPWSPNVNASAGAAFSNASADWTGAVAMDAASAVHNAERDAVRSLEHAARKELPAMCPPLSGCPVLLALMRIAAPRTNAGTCRRRAIAR